MSPALKPFRVLYVCTGNICRSAVAERLLRRELQERLGDDADLLVVESVGVHGLSGEPMDADSAAALEALGGDPGEFIARRMDAEHIRGADLVLTANRKHRATVVRLDPTAVRRTFTMREFASLAEQADLAALPDVDPASRLAAAVEEVGAARGMIRPGQRQDFDVADPYGGPASLHRDTVKIIAAAAEATAAVLAAAVRPGLAPPPAEVLGTPPPENASAPAPPMLGTPPASASVADPGPPDPDTGARTQPEPSPSRGRTRRTQPEPSASRGRTQPRPSVARTRTRRSRRPLMLVIAAVALLLVAATAWLAWSGLSARRELEASKPLVSKVRAAVLAGDPAKARAALTSLQEHTTTARERTGGPLWGLAQHLPAVGDDLTAVRTVTVAVDDVARTVLPPLVRVSDTVRPEKLRVSGDRVNLAPLRAAAPTLRQAAGRGRAVRSRVDAVATNGLVAPVASAVTDVRGKVDELASTTLSAARAADLIPPMLGADGPRRYFLAFQNNAEARGTGGLLGAYGILRADHGRLRVDRLGPNTELQNPSKLPVDLGKDYQALYGETPPWWVNGNVSPNFPDAGRIWTAMWRQQFGQRLDGVIATDPVALGYVLKATGPARLPDGGQISAGNATALTMRKVYERFPSGAENTVRDRYLQGVAATVFDKLLSGAGDPKALAQQLEAAAGERRLLVYSAHRDDQRRLEATSLAGALPRGDRPFAGLVVNNYSGSKLDYYLDRSMTYARSRCRTRDGRTASRITVSLTNTAPAKGLPAYVDQRLDRDSFRGRAPSGASTSVVQVLATAGSDLASARLDGKDVLVAAGRQQGNAVFQLNVTLRAGQTRTVVLDLSEPATTGRPELMRAQPLVRPMHQRMTTTRC